MAALPEAGAGAGSPPHVVSPPSGPSSRIGQRRRCRAAPAALRLMQSPRGGRGGASALGTAPRGAGTSHGRAGIQ